MRANKGRLSERYSYATGRLQETKMTTIKIMGGLHKGEYYNFLLTNEVNWRERASAQQQRKPEEF